MFQPVDKDVEQFTEADHLAVMLFAVKKERSWQKDMPAGVGGLVPPFYCLIELK